MLTTFLADVSDFRRRQGQRYELHNILLLSVIAILCNAKSYRDISRFISTKFEEIKRELSLKWKHPPAYTTIRNIIKGIDSQQMEAPFRAFTQSMTRYGIDETLVRICVDGKLVRGSFDHFEDRAAMQKLTFFDADDFLILGHEPIEDKTNEIPVFQSLLHHLEIPCTLFSADAIHCQKKLLQKRKASMDCWFSSRKTSPPCWKMYIA
jgi:hypothetical protein